MALLFWRHSLEIVKEELELISKKKEALDSLSSSGEISEATFNHIYDGLENSLKEATSLKNAISKRMTARAEDIEKQRNSLEILLANLEMFHAAEEVDQTTYHQQAEALKFGLEALNGEIEETKQALSTLKAKTAVSTSENDSAMSGESEEEIEGTEESPSQS